MRPSLYFIENLTLPLWWGLLWPRLAVARLRGRAPGGIFAIDASTVALRAAQLSARVLDLSVERLAFRLVEVRDDEGRLLRLRIAYQDLAEAQEEAMAEPVFQNLVRAGLARGRVLTYLAKNIASISLSSRGVMWRALLLVQIGVWQRKHLGLPDADVTLFLERRAWQAAIARYAARFRVRVVTVPPTPVPHEMARRLLGPTGIGLLHLMRYRLRRLRGPERAASPSPPRDARVPASNGPEPSTAAGAVWRGPKIVAPYLGHLNLDRPEQNSDLFFWQQSELSGTDLVVTFQAPADPLEPAKLAELTRHGMQPVVLHSDATRVPDVPLIVPHPSLRDGRLGLAARVIGRGPEAAWLRRQLDTYDALRAYWMHLFEAVGGRVYVTWYKYDATHCVIADAMRQVGGVTAVYQRAFEAHPSVETTIDADVAFGFSPAVAGIERHSHSTIRYHVTTGYLGDHRFPLLREQARLVREALRAHGAEFIIAFTDENSADDSRWHTGHGFMRVNYAFLLERLLAEPWLGLVLKPKVPSTLRRRLGTVSDTLERALATGRCHVFEGGAIHGSHPPAVAALCADVMIHGHLCAATAGAEAALAGAPTLLLDREGWPVSPLYELGVGRVVFQDWEDLWRALLEHRRRPGGVPGFGDWSAMLPEIDPFRDGLAARRMGEYLTWLIEGFKAGEDRDVVMARAAGRYAARWGDDKVTEVRGQWGSTSTMETGRGASVEVRSR